eukprot:12924580-Heterocapsa_arctica.AAC.1
MTEKTGHEQCQKALLSMGLVTDGIEAKLKADQNSRHGWVPHTAIFNWLQELWEDQWTQDMFWNMLLHSKNDN